MSYRIKAEGSFKVKGPIKQKRSHFRNDSLTEKFGNISSICVNNSYEELQPFSFANDITDKSTAY